MATHLETLDYRRHIENPFSEDFNEVANELKEWNYRVGRWEYRTIDLDNISILEYKSNWLSDLEASLEVDDHTSTQHTDITHLSPVVFFPAAVLDLNTSYSESIFTIADHRVTEIPSLASTLLNSTHLPLASSPSLSQAPASYATKKRKSATVDDFPLCKPQKQCHNATEKRYRMNLNEKLSQLSACVPFLFRPRGSKVSSKQNVDAEGVEAVQTKYGKGAMLTRALEYIKNLEETVQRLDAEGAVLKTRVGAFEMLATNKGISFD